MKYLRWFTFLDKDELAELETATTERPHAREAQKRLAAEMTTLVHGAHNTAAVELASAPCSVGGNSASWTSPRSRPP